MFGVRCALSKDRLNTPEGAPLVGGADLTPLAALPPPEYLLQASLLYSDALNGLHTLRPPLLSRRTRRAYIAVRAMEFATTGALAALLVVGFFETPWWCHDNDLCRSPEYPTFVDGKLFLSVRRGVLVETACLAVLAASYSLERVYLGKQFWSGKRTLVLPLWVKNAALCVYVVDLLMALVSKGFRFAPYCRIAIFVASYAPMWHMLGVIFRILPDCVDAGLFLIAYILFSVWIATSTFDKGPEHQSPYMRDFKETLWTLMVLLSNNAYPSAMMPAYDINRLTFLFFALYLLIGMFVLMNLTFAVLYTAFMKRHLSSSERRGADAEASLRDCFAVFDEQGKGSGRIKLRVIRAFLIHEYGGALRNFDEDLALHIADLTSKPSALAFAAPRRRVMDDESTINARAFVRIMAAVGERIRVAQRRTEVQRFLPRLAAAPAFRRLADYVENENCGRFNAFELLVDGILVANLVTLVLSTRYIRCEEEDSPRDCPVVGLDLSFTLLFLVEMLIKVAVKGWYHYWIESHNKLDAIVTVLSCFATVIYFTWTDALRKFFKLIIILRQLRLVRLLRYTVRFRVLTDTFRAMAPTAVALLGVLFSYYYVFGSAGTQILGGYICTAKVVASVGTAEELGLVQRNVTCLHHDEWDPSTNDYAAAGYFANNFNDLLGSFVILFELMVTNDWQTLVEGYVEATGTRWVRAFFVVNYACLVVLLSNLVVAMIIKTYIEEWDKFTRHRDRENGVAAGQPADDDAPGPPPGPPRDETTDDDGNESSFSI